MTTTKVNSASPVQENVNLSVALHAEKTYICEKIKEFAFFRQDLKEHLETSIVAENLEVLSDLLAETENTGEEYYSYLLSIFGMIMEREARGE